MKYVAYILTVLFCTIVAMSYNNCANNDGVLDGSVISASGEPYADDTPIVPDPPPIIPDPPIDIPPPPPPHPPPPPANTPAYLTFMRATASGANVEFTGPAQGLRYKYDATDPNWTELVGPFTSPYTMSFVWPEPATTYTCFQIMGTDGVWRGAFTADPLDLQQCNQVPSP